LLKIEFVFFKYIATMAAKRARIVAGPRTLGDIVAEFGAPCFPLSDLFTQAADTPFVDAVGMIAQHICNNEGFDNHTFNDMLVVYPSASARLLIAVAVMSGKLPYVIREDVLEHIFDYAGVWNREFTFKHVLEFL
jgi:hypothetical protein